jgi:hypothetical protein
MINPNPTENLPPTESTEQTARTVAEAQSAMQTWINRLLWVLIIGLGIYTFITWRNRAEENNRELAAATLSSVETIALELADGALDSQPLEMFPVEKRAEIVRKAVSQAAAGLDSMATLTEDPTLAAAAGVVRGDLNWALGTLTPPPEATTRPALAYVPEGQDPLEFARRSYKAVVDNFPTQHVSVARARLGLAAIAENKREFDAAKAAYQTLIDDTATPSAFADIAKMRQTILPQLAVQVRIDFTPTTQPTVTIPAVDVPPSPQTQPATPSTQP